MRPLRNYFAFVSSTNLYKSEWSPFIGRWEGVDQTFVQGELVDVDCKLPPCLGPYTGLSSLMVAIF